MRNFTNTSRTLISDLAKQMRTASLLPSLIIPRRKCGQDIKHNQKFIQKEFTLEVNYLPIRFKDMKLKIFHYDVSFKPEAPKALFR